MPVQQKLKLRSQDGASKESEHQANERTTNTSPPPPSSSDTAGATDQMAEDISKIYTLLKETSEKQDAKLNSIEASTRAVDNKLTDLATRLGDAEARIAFLEDANVALEANPPATRAEVEDLLLKLDDLENRSRRNNLRFIGFPEKCEKSDALTFMRDTIPELLNVEFDGGLEIDRAHRTPGRRKQDDQRQPPRPIIIRLLRFQDRERIVEAARKMGKLQWNGHHIMIFPDYSKLVTEKRAAFKQSKQLLHQKKIAFSLRYPAVLVLELPSGKRQFSDPKKALTFINSLQ